MSTKVALALGLTSSIFPMIVLVSLGKSRSKRHGPLMTSGFELGAGAGVDVGSMFSAPGVGSSR